MGVYFTLWISQLSLFILLVLLSQLWPWGAPSGWFWYLFSPIIFKHFLTFWHHKMFQAYLVFSLPQSWTQLFLQGALVN